MLVVNACILYILVLTSDCLWWMPNFFHSSSNCHCLTEETFALETISCPFAAPLLHCHHRPFKRGITLSAN
ncbi:hypothetical protein K7X08_007207 [Anisodus acutangulus]|uniref:Secreted protein n=1 Tax=Anisodus acutangulus TaxID=402998 RepID=A0A9Q1QZQ1_9SOLA|nr:hypothetical protein K7X08_007207 [Anisodus acutangulus]